MHRCRRAEPVPDLLSEGSDSLQKKPAVEAGFDSLAIELPSSAGFLARFPGRVPGITQLLLSGRIELMKRGAFLAGCFRGETLPFEFFFTRKRCGEFLFLAPPPLLGFSGELFLAEPFPLRLASLASFLDGSAFGSQGHQAGVVGTRS